VLLNRATAEGIAAGDIRPSPRGQAFLNTAR
jgi:hypothetical protein